jgi:hypothetical protein
MTVHITVPIEAEALERARERASDAGIPVDQYLAQILSKVLVIDAPSAKGHVSDIFGLVTDGEPTDIGRDKDKMIGEAVWQEHLRKTRQT